VKLIRASLSSGFEGIRAIFIHLVVSSIPDRVKNQFTVTCRRDDGGGAQLHGRLSLIAFCMRFSIPWFNTPISGAHFSTGDNWDRNWNKLFEFEKMPGCSNDGRNWPERKVRGALGIALILLMNVGFKRPRKLVLVAESAHDYTNVFSSSFETAKNVFRQGFRPHPGAKAGGIVVHVRRGTDVTAEVRRETDQSIIARVSQLAHQHPELNVTIYSNEKIPWQFAIPQNYVLDYSSTPFEAVTHMATADFLIIAKSSMSYVAAIVCDGQVYSPDFWHPRLANWLSVSTLESQAL
jgi:hypothetical protein